MMKLINDIITNCGIYCITNLITGKKYIGQSQNLKQRYSYWKCKHFKKNKSLDHDLKEFEKNNFIFEIICYCSIDYLDEFEKFWINKYSTEQLYNMQSGGILNWKHSEKTKKQISKTKQNKKGEN